MVKMGNARKLQRQDNTQRRKISGHADPQIVPHPDTQKARLGK